MSEMVSMVLNHNFTRKMRQSCFTLIGDEIRLTCKVKGKPKPKTVWLKNGQGPETWVHQDIYFQEIEETEETTTTEMKIGEAYPEDQGQYTCIAVNEYGRDETTTTVTVERKVIFKS